MSALDDVTLVSLQAMRASLLVNIRRSTDLGSRAMVEDYRAQLRTIESEILQRTAKFAHRANEHWTAADDTRLQRLVRAGETIECIASTLGRSTVAISQRAQRFGIEFGDDGVAVQQGAEVVS